MRCSICGRKDCCGAQLVPEIDRLREALKDLIDTLDQHAVMSFGWAEDNARAALQEDSDE